MCIATPPPARLRCHLLPTVSSRGPKIASRVKRERERDVTWPAITAPDAAAPAIRLPMAISGSAMCNSCYLGSATCAARRSSRTTGDRSTVASWVAPCGQNADCCIYLFHAQDNMLLLFKTIFLQRFYVRVFFFRISLEYPECSEY